MLGRGDLIHQWMFRGKDHEGCTPQRVWTGRKYLDRISSLIIPEGGCLENNGGAFASTDPIRLQCFDAFWPVNAIKVQQLIGIFCGSKEPLFQFLLNDRCTTAFAQALFANDLLSRQCRVVLR